MPNINSEYTYLTPFGHITIASNGNEILRVAIGQISFGFPIRPDAITNKAAEQLLEYFSGKRNVFDIVMRIGGSDFQKDILRAIYDIPYSQTRTSQEIAESAGHANAYRQVGSIIKANPIAILIPSHRVVSANGYYDKDDKFAKINAALRMHEMRFSK